MAPPAAARYRLGDYRDYSPSPLLGPVAEGVWTHRVAPAAMFPHGAMHRVLPDPALSVAFRCRREPDGRPIDPQLLIIGPKTRPHVFPLLPGWETSAVRLKLEWVAPVLGLIPAEHHDQERMLADVAPTAAKPFEQLVDTRSCDDAARVLSAALISLARGRTGGFGRAAVRALELVRRTRGGMPIDRVAGATGRSTRHLRRSVQREAGISLKAYARVARLLHAVTAADLADLPAWARIAGDCGFCDQSHLVRECRALTGLTPGQVHRERRAEAETSNTG